MGFGPCKVKVRRMRRRPKDAPPLPESIIESKVNCQTFYWNPASAALKTACLSLFLVVEGPRRVFAYAQRQPEPKPLFLDCSPWGYRMCACNHHFYDHHPIGVSLQPPLSPAPEKQEIPHSQVTYLPPDSLSSTEKKGPIFSQESLLSAIPATKPNAESEVPRRRKRFWLF